VQAAEAAPVRLMVDFLAASARGILR